MKKSLFASALFLASAFALAQQRELPQETTADAEEAAWQVASSDQGVLVFFQETPGNPLHEIKAETIVRGNIEAAYAILNDPMNILTADPYIQNPHKIGNADSLGAYYYAEFHTPFFLKNRDFVVKAYSSKLPTGYFMVWKSFFDYLPENENFIRMKNISLKIYLKKLNQEYYSITYRISMSPEGNEMAINFTNKSLVESSLERMKALRRLVTGVDDSLSAKAGEDR